MSCGKKEDLRRKVLFLVFIFIMSTFLMLLNGCSNRSNNWLDLWNQQGKAETKVVAGRVDEIDMILLLTEAIRGDADAITYFQAIPAKQLDGLNSDEFIQYIKLLKRGISGDVHSFTAMSSTELAQAQEEMIAALPQQEELINRSVGYWIFFRQSGKTDQKFAVFMQKDDEDLVYLSADWIRQVLSIANYASLYFNALDNFDTQSLVFLFDQNDEKSAVSLAKAEHLIKFYNENISSRTSEYRLKLLRLDSIAFDQYGITYPDLSQAVSRTVHFYIDEGNNFSAKDVIPEIVQSSDLVIFKDGEILLAMGGSEDSQSQLIWSHYLEGKTGQPFKHDDSNCKPYGDGISLINLSYNGITVSVQGDCYDHDSWNGFIRSVILKNNQYYTGSGLRPGMPLDELLVRYPFAAESDYTIRKETDNGTANMSIIVENDIIEKIEISFVPQSP